MTLKSLNNGPLPSFFRCAVTEARNSTYANAGYTLSRHLGDLLDEPVRLDAALESDDPAHAIWVLIVEQLPRCAALIPARRRETFLRGIERALEEGLV